MIVCLASYLRLFICLFGLNIISASAEDNILDLGDNILEELMNTPISVATKTVQFRKSRFYYSDNPEEIERRGARDLIDILNFVPGLEVGFDITGTYGVAVRGVWGNEGKVLVLLGWHITKLTTCTRLFNTVTTYSEIISRH